MKDEIIADLEKEKAIRKKAETEIARMKETNIHRQIHDSSAFDELKLQIQEAQKAISDSKIEIADARENNVERVPWLTNNLKRLKEQYSEIKKEHQVKIDHLKRRFISIKYTGSDEMEKLL